MASLEQGIYNSISSFQSDVNVNWATYHSHTEKNSRIQFDPKSVSEPNSFEQCPFDVHAVSIFKPRCLDVSCYT